MIGISAYSPALFDKALDQIEGWEEDGAMQQLWLVLGAFPAMWFAVRITERLIS